MGGGGTTFQTTAIPSSVENLMNSAAQRMGGLHSLLDIGSFAPSNVPRTAQINAWQQHAGEARADWASGVPQEAHESRWYANNAANRVGDTPLEFAWATSTRPHASQAGLDVLPQIYNVGGEVSSLFNVPRSATSQQGLDLLGQLYNVGGEVSPWFNLPRTGENQQAWALANAMFPTAQQALERFSPVQQYAAQVPTDYASLLALSQGVNLAPTGANLANSPSLQAAQQAFNTAILPTIENQAAVAGLGRSTALTNAIAQAQAQYMLPVVQGELDREFQANLQRYGALQNIGLPGASASERGIERGANIGLQYALASQQLPQILGTEAQMMRQLDQDALARQLELAQAQERGGIRRGDALSSMISTLQAAGQEDTARQLELAQATERGGVRRMDALNTAMATLQSQGQQDLARQLEMATARERALDRYGNVVIPGMQNLTNLAQMETARRDTLVDRTRDYGALLQQTEQAGYDAAFNDFLRRQALAEQSLFSPFGQIIPSAFGQKVKQPGGLFK